MTSYIKQFRLFFLAFGLFVLLFGFTTGCRKESPGAKSEKDFLPKRVICMIPSYTEVLFALDLGDRIVAVSDFCNHPEAARALPRVGGLLNPNLEQVLSFEPDLVILMATQIDLMRHFATLGIRTLALRTDTMEEIRQGIRTIGETFGTSAAEGLIEKIEADFARVRTKAQGRARPRSLLVVGHQPGELREVYAAGPKSFLGTLLSLAGGENIYGGSAQAFENVTIESIVERNPEVIVVLSGKPGITAEDQAVEVKTWSKLPTVAAVKAGRVTLLGADPVAFPGPRLGRSAEILSRIVHPDAWKP